jgi:hypothetical protein
VGLLRCPQCSAVAPLFADRVTEEEPVPRITVAAGPSNAAAAPGEPGYVEAAAEAPVVAEEPVPEAVELPVVETVVPVDVVTEQQDAKAAARAKAQQADAPADAAPAALAEDTGTA